jgi:hypothetical protein
MDDAPCWQIAWLVWAPVGGCPERAVRAGGQLNARIRARRRPVYVLLTDRAVNDGLRWLGLSDTKPGLPRINWLLPARALSAAAERSPVSSKDAR